MNDLKDNDFLLPADTWQTQTRGDIEMETKIWKYSAISGIWTMVHACEMSHANQVMSMFESSDVFGLTVYRISDTEPTFNPFYFIGD